MPVWTDAENLAPLPPPGFDPQTVQLVASRCTISALICNIVSWKMYNIKVTVISLRISTIHNIYVFVDSVTT